MTRRLRAAAGAPRPWYHVGPVLALAEPGGPTGTGEGSTADVYVFDTIGGWFGLTADDFVRDVATLDVDQIVLHLNSPGGDATEGTAIANVLRAHRARVVVRVDGMAASAASIIAMAGDEIVMGIGSQLMVHDAWGYAVGNAAEMAAAQRMLDSVSDAYASAYAARAGGTAAEWREVMRAEAWYTAEEAVAAGLANRVATADETGTAAGEQITPGLGGGSFWDMWDSLSAADRFDLSAFTYAGRPAAPDPVMPGRQTPAARAAGPSRHERSRAVAFSDEQLSTMRQQLGLAADADEATIVAAQTEALAERANPPAPTPTPALPDGVVAVEASVLEELRTRAARGDAARTRQEADDRVALVSAAVNEGRIDPARRDAWLARLEADPGEAATLAALQPGVAVPVGRPVGHAGGGEPAEDGPDERIQKGRDLYGRRHAKSA